ncbi:MAG: 50S ribosomal protein L11 methyltransferase, partial [Oscillospiraceae bacterium]|nr:50S ribosomal protein L11 methyltransferase [Oscillospiraceae bacterium]
KDEDWENNWKAYYKPVTVGERLFIVPSWEEAPEAPGRVILRLDPGLIFGTGTHATTRMCLEEIEKLDLDSERVLDLGCGSGILAIAALLCGAESAFGCDIDPKAPDIVMENAALNGIGPEDLTVRAGDVLADTRLQKMISKSRYGLVLANIVADVIIALAPLACGWLSEDGRFICSGIIEGRQAEVEKALRDAGFTLAGHRCQEDWHCYICERTQRK